MDQTKRDAPERSEIDAGVVGGNAPGKATLTSRMGRGPSAEAEA